MNGTRRPTDVSTKLLKIETVARNHPGQALTTLSRHVDVALLREAFRLTRKDGAVGVDRQTAADYAEHLEENLQSLCDRFHKGSYFAPPVRRVNIPKGNGRTRPIGIPTFEDKVLQRAIAMILNAIYEQDFLDCSYGFRPRRSAHDALQALRNALMELGGGYVIDMDIKAFFDTIDHKVLRQFLDLRVRDGVVRRMIDKWLKAGIFENGEVRRNEGGTPQGGVVSPILANVMLHHVLDEWFTSEVLPRMRGRARLVRYADDAVIVCEQKQDMERIMAVLTHRFERFGLTLHPEKTKVVDFRRNAPERDKDDDGPTAGPTSFDFLGFTHHWARSRRGYKVVKQRTMKSRLSRGLKAVGEWCRRNRHLPVKKQHEALSRKLLGHYAYYGVIGNSRMLGQFLHQAKRLWRYWLHRRAEGRHMPWERFNMLLQHYPLPAPRIRRPRTTA